MKNPELRRSLIETGKSHFYILKRREYFKTQVIEHTYFNDKTKRVETILKDRKTGKLVKAIPGNPEYFYMTQEELEECERIRKSIREQSRRLKDHIAYLLEEDQDCYLMTFNFSDEALKIDRKKRKARICRLLDQISDDYLINIDYGDKTNREHYHAIIQLKNIEKVNIYVNEKKHTKHTALDKYQYGFYDMKLIKKTKTSIYKLTRYTNKLTLHSIKVKQQYISSKKNSIYNQLKNPPTETEILKIMEKIRLQHI